MTQNVNLNAYRRENAYVRMHAASGRSSSEVTANGTFATGDVLGGRMYFEGAGGFANNGILMALDLVDYGAVGPQVDVFLYAEEPASIANDAAFAEAEADALNRIGIISVGSSDWVAIGAGAKTVHKEMSIPFTGSSLWAYLVVRGTPTYTSDKILAVINTFHE